MRTTVTVDDRAISAAFARLLAAGANPREYMEPIGQSLAENTRLRFSDGQSPSGAPWRAVLRGGQPLLDKGLLRNSVSHQAQGDSVVVGVPYGWAAVHQFGAIIRAKLRPYLRFRIGDRWAMKRQVTIPARPFLGISAQDRTDISEILRRVLLGAK